MDHAFVFPSEHHPRATTPTDSLGPSSDPHFTVVLDYCTLALQPSLSQADEDRLAAILAQSMEDPQLSFWLEEADAWLNAHHLNLVNDDTLKQQQHRLRRLLGQTRLTNFLEDLQQRTKALQADLQRAGLYTGAIDGIMGPSTVLAVESLKQKEPKALPLDWLLGTFGSL